MKKLLALASLLVLSGSLGAGCGSEGGSSADTGTAAKTPPLTARFVEYTDHKRGGKQWRETVRGAFDWTAHEGWVEIRSRKPGSILRIVQARGSCFERADQAAWKQSRPRNIHNEPDPEGICDEQFVNPRTELQSLREIYPDHTEVVGKEEVGGVTTTHYSLFVHETPLDEQYDLWVDESGTARRKRIDTRDYHDHVRAVTSRTYYDFGAQVKVAPPLAQDG